MRRICIICSLAIAVLLLPIHSMGGSFKVTPVKLFLDSKTKATVLKITNNGDENVTVQLDAKEWSQDETGTDKYDQTKEIIFFPKIVTIDPGEERIIRVGHQVGKAGATEKTYRLFLQELPVRKPGEIALKLALRMGIPIFISPLKEVKEHSIEGTEFSEGSLKVKVRNSGNTHFIVGKITATGIDESDSEVFSKEANGWYVLPGVSKTFSINIPREDCLKATKIMAGVEVESAKMDSEVGVDESQCVQVEDVSGEKESEEKK